MLYHNSYEEEIRRRSFAAQLATLQRQSYVLEGINSLGQ